MNRRTREEALRKTLWLSFCVLAFATCANAQMTFARAAGFPDRVVRLVIPFPAGGATDIITRVVAQQLSATWENPVIVDNVAGATGTIAAVQIARALPDGYNLMVGTGSVNSVLPSVRSGLAFDTLRDYEAVSMLATFPNVLVVRSEFPAKSIADLISLLKAHPGQYNYGSGGFGTTMHLAAELFKLQTKTEMTHIAYKGSAPAIEELLAGHIDMMFDNLADVTSYIKNGDLRALGVAGPERSPFLPDVPAIAETLPGFEVTSWVGLLAPANTPTPIVAKIADDVRQALQDPRVVEAFNNIGADRADMSSDAFAAFLRSDVEKWRHVVHDASIKLE